MQELLARCYGFFCGRDSEPPSLKISLNPSGREYEPMSIRDQWTSGLDYERWMGRWSRLLAQKFLHWLALPACLRWIDVCCGSGFVTETIVVHAVPGIDQAYILYLYTLYAT